MADIGAISERLNLGEDGIWYSEQRQLVSYPEEGNAAYFAIEDDSFWFQHRNQCIVSAVEAFPPPQCGTIFDIGGGNGYVAHGLSQAGFDVVLVEPGPSGASNAKRRGLQQVICATTDTAGFKPGSLPAIGLFDVIEHIDDDRAFLQSMHGLLADGGCVYATVPAYSLLWSDEDELVGHYRRYRLGQICELFARAGFNVDFASYFFRFLPLPILLLRVLPYRLGLVSRKIEAQNVSRDHRVKSRFVNRILQGLLDPELSRLRQKQSMAFGGSCLVVARAKS